MSFLRDILSGQKERDELRAVVDRLRRAVDRIYPGAGKAEHPSTVIATLEVWVTEYLLERDRRREELFERNRHDKSVGFPRTPAKNGGLTCENCGGDVWDRDEHFEFEDPNRPAWTCVRKT